MRSLFDYEDLSENKAKLIARLVELSNNTQFLSLKVYTYLFILFATYHNYICKYGLEWYFSFLFSLWFLSCIAYNLTEERIDSILEKIEDYASSENEENVEVFHFFMELENTEGFLSLFINGVMACAHIYALIIFDYRLAIVCLVVRLFVREIIKAIELRYK